MTRVEPLSSTAYLLEISRKHYPPHLDICRDESEEVSSQQDKTYNHGSPQSSGDTVSLSLTSLTRVKPIDLLKRGSPKSKALEQLRAKIQQQKLETISSSPVIEIKCQDHIIRKVCRVSSKGQ